MSLHTYSVAGSGAQSIRCELCGRVSHNPSDVEYKFCGWCHIFHSEALAMLTLYDHPTDYPWQFVARMCAVTPQGHVIQAQQPLALADSLGQLREMLPAGLTCLGRQPNDDPKIVEVWL